MKFKLLLVALTALMLALFMIACEGPDQPTYTAENDPNPTGLSPATITSLSTDSALFRQKVLINGSGFNTDPAYNFVAFGSKTAKILNVTSSQIEVQAPSYSDAIVDVKVAVKGSEFWSNAAPLYFKDAAALVHVVDEEISWPNGVAVDDDDNVYIGSANDGVIYKIDPAGTKTEFSPAAISGAMEFGPNGYLYVCEQGEGKIVRISPDGSTTEDVVEVESPIDFDWDANGNMYIVANWTGIFKMDTGGNLAQVAEVGNGKCIRIFESNLYITDIWNGTILKYDITDTGLENEEIVYEGDSPLGLEFDSDGTMYFTEAWETSIYLIEQDGTSDVIFEELLTTPMHYLTFYHDRMYIVFPGWGDVGQTLMCEMPAEQAPNYGRP
jgi:sugar lactone lactonase YvrE